MNINTIVVRNERADDFTVISHITKLAFEKIEISNHTEHLIIDALRSAKALTVSLVAEIDGVVVGHIAFSPVSISDNTNGWYGLGPVSVHPDQQNKGVGKALIQEGLQCLKKINAKGCCLVGHPSYYPQFGFNNVEGLSYEGVPKEVFFALSFDNNIPEGNVVFHEAFRVSN